MDNATIRAPQNQAATNPLTRSKSQTADKADAQTGKSGFSLLLADMAESALPALAGEAGDGLANSQADSQSLAGLLVDPLASSLDASALPASELTQPQLMDSGILALTSLVAQTARMDNAADAALRDGRTLEGGKSARSPLPVGQFAAASTQAQTAADRGADAASAALAAAAADAVPQATNQPSTVSLTQPSKDIERTAQPHGLAALLAQMDVEPTPAAMHTFAATLESRPATAAGESAAVGAAQAQGQEIADTAAPGDAPLADAQPLLPDDAFADQLTEQVAFWVQQKTQRAEMTIDRQGQPVQVQVQVTGNEAHVTFRTNEQQTRDMLDASVAQLRDLLEQQGLSLAGVDVQTTNSGQQGAFSGGREPAQSGERVQRQTVQLPADLRARAQPERGVDLFV